MHLRRVSIENLRSLRRVEWRAPEASTAGWHVVLGENASGKTTFLRAIARTLLGYPGAQHDLDPHPWCRDGAAKGEATLFLRGHRTFDKGKFDPNEDELAELVEDPSGEPRFEHVSKARAFGLLPHGISDGWLSVGYGPYRRFTGGESRLKKYAAPSFARVERHLSLFNEGAVLPEGVQWLSKLGFRALEEQNKSARNGRSRAKNGEAARLLEGVKSLLQRPGLLPHGKLAEVSSEGVFFTVGRGAPRSITQLSDGYKSVLSIVFDVLRHMEQAFGAENVLDADGEAHAPAVVLIDEIDIHLHPTWQQRIGAALTRCFPNVQFIVTTHSPIICQAADSVILLRKGIGEQLEGAALDRMRYGNILDALSTGAFGEDVARSKKSLQMLKRLSDLNQRAMRGEALTEREREEHARLRSIMLTMDMDRPGEDT